MTTIKKSISLPWDFIIDKIFKEYGSKDFYKEFKEGWYKFSPEITIQWQKDYMNESIWVVQMTEFFAKVYSWKPSFEKKFKSFDYDTVIAHILPIAAPTFFEQLFNTNSETND